MQKSAYLKITRPANQCLNCEADLLEAQKHPSAVYNDESDEALERKDYCPKCWEKIQQEGYFSFWIAKREASTERTRISREERNKLLLAFFEHVGTGEGPSEVGRDAYRFFLAHLLMRFRVFRWARTDGDSGAIHFENIQTGEEWLVSQVDMDDETILAIKQELEEYLRKGEDLEVGF